MYLKVDKNGKVKISAPHSIRKEEIISFCESKLDWIKLKQIEILKNNHSRKIKVGKFKIKESSKYAFEQDNEFSFEDELRRYKII